MTDKVKIDEKPYSETESISKEINEITVDRHECSSVIVEHKSLYIVNKDDHKSQVDKEQEKLIYYLITTSSKGTVSVCKTAG